MNKRGFICAGCWTVDRIKLIDLWPNEEQLALIQQVERQGGGSAHNVGIDLRKLDPSLPVATVGMLGLDDDGDFLFKQATDHQLDTSGLFRTDEKATSYTDVMSVVGSGKRTFFHHTGTNDLLAPHHFNFAESSARILHLGLLSLHATMDAPTASGGNGWSTVLQQAKEHGLATSIEMVSIDPQRNRALVAPCLPYLDYLIVNDQEIGCIADIPTLHDGLTLLDNCLEAAWKVLSMGKMKLVAVHFPAGALCVTRDGQHFHAPSLAIPQSQIVSSVGAGDGFYAGFIYGVHEHWPIDKSLALAHAVAAASLRSASTVGSVGSVHSCQQLSREWGTVEPVLTLTDKPKT